MERNYTYLYKLPYVIILFPAEFSAAKQVLCILATAEPELSHSILAKVAISSPEIRAALELSQGWALSIPDRASAPPLVENVSAVGTKDHRYEETPFESPKSHITTRHAGDKSRSPSQYSLCLPKAPHYVQGCSSPKKPAAEMVMWCCHTSLLQLYCC